MHCDPVVLPPNPGNLKRKRGWQQQHRLVAAELQSLAVEALLLHQPPMLPGQDYAPEHAISIAHDRKLPLSTLGARPSTGVSDMPGLIEVNDDALLRMSTLRTRWIDHHNQCTFAKTARQRRLLRSRAGSMVSARGTVDPGWSALSYMARRAELKERRVLVSAWDQATAVAMLYQTKKMRVHRDYPPQDAIALAREECTVRHPAQSPMTSVPTAPPPAQLPLYPDLPTAAWGTTA
jgi:hypothetical protein